MTLNFAANLSFLFQDLPFEKRFQAAAKAGFKGCEFLFPYAFEPCQINDWLDQAGIELALFNLSPGDWDEGERGLAALNGRQREFVDSLDQAIEYANVIGCKRLHIMAGCVGDDMHKSARKTYIDNLSFVADKLQSTNIIGLIEPINPFDMPGYFLNDVTEALDILNEIGATNLKLQYDCYHRAMVGKDIIEGINLAGDKLAHIQIAGYPGRNEPYSGSLDYTPIFNRLIELKYDGWIGCEYHPLTDTISGLEWLNGNILP